MAAKTPLVLIADAHVSQSHGNVDPFFEMLDALSGALCDVIFLGDIFDLWISLPRYEEELHIDFLSWCRSQKKRRSIGFIEGNHEFFLSQQHASAFTWCTDRAWWTDAEGNLFCHGDLINRFDRNYRLFRKCVRNPVTKTLIRLMPRGPRIVQHIKNGMKNVNQTFRKSLPLDQLQAFAEERFAEGAARIFLGHFHHPYHYQGRQSGEMNTLPDWFSQGRIGVLPADRGALQQGPWQQILPTG